MVSRVAKYCIGLGTLGFSGAVAYSFQDDYSSLGVVRLARTAITAAEIGWLYHSRLYTPKWDKNSKEYREAKKDAHLIGAGKLLELCRANKGVYIKVGQHVGALDYLLPSEYVNTMRVLHKDAPKNTLEQLYAVIEEDLKVDPRQLFTEFDPEPLGTASLAQVHRAKLCDGREVAVKVQHHFVRKNTKTDLIWMELMINIMMKVFPDFQMGWLVEETKHNIGKELDFVQEGKNAEKVAGMFKDYLWLKVPKIYWNYSTERVLVMEYVQGGQINDLDYIKEHKINRVALAKKIGDLYSHMIFVVGFVHSDPHPGNILVKQGPKDKDSYMYLLDHGLYANLTEEFRYNYSKLWLSIINRNKSDMMVYSEKLGIRKELYGLFACIVTGRPWESIMKGIGKTAPTSLEKESLQEGLPQFLQLVTECLQHVDRQALLVLKTNDLIRGIEYALETQDKMPGFMVMTKCCMQSVHNYEIKHSTPLRKMYLSLRYFWSNILFHIYSMYLGIAA